MAGAATGGLPPHGLGYRTRALGTGGAAQLAAQPHVLCGSDCGCVLSSAASAAAVRLTSQPTDRCHTEFNSRHGGGSKEKSYPTGSTLCRVGARTTRRYPPAFA